MQADPNQLLAHRAEDFIRPASNVTLVINTHDVDVVHEFQTVLGDLVHNTATLVAQGSDSFVTAVAKYPAGVAAVGRALREVSERHNVPVSWYWGIAEDIRPFE